MAHRSGFVNIIGNPNVGKSTIMNKMVGEKVSIITSKSQTTRHRILGIVNGEDFQIVYSDTPGIIKPAYRLQENMMSFVGTAMEDADVIVYVTDVVEKFMKNEQYVERLKETDTPVLVLVNKIDLSNQEEVTELMQRWKETLPKAEIIPMSALKDHNLNRLLQEILDRLPENPAFFPKDQLTDKTERFIVSEIIREKILMKYKQEIPYSVEVVVESFKEDEKIIRIEATIFVARDSQKGILIGRKGAALKKVGQLSRADAEEFFGKQVYLGLYVKVKKDWRNDDRMLRQFGYQG
ncbi:MAG TPA: GTPase Era [Bacteroidales bacterium]|nr:GTPase Era [Bacteroidales bacterium]